MVLELELFYRFQRKIRESWRLKMKLMVKVLKGDYWERRQGGKGGGGARRKNSIRETPVRVWIAVRGMGQK